MKHNKLPQKINPCKYTHTNKKTQGNKHTQTHSINTDTKRRKIYTKQKRNTNKHTQTNTIYKKTQTHKHTETHMNTNKQNHTNTQRLKQYYTNFPK